MIRTLPLTLVQMMDTINASDVCKGWRQAHDFRRVTAMQMRISLRMSLRTLMLLVLVIGGGLGWLAVHRQRELRRQWVITTIRGSLSSVEFDGIGISQIFWGSGRTVNGSLFQSQLTADQIEALGSCARLRELTMLSSVMTDEGLASLSRDHLIMRLYCFKPKITDAGVKHLAKLKSLKRLELLRVPGLTDATLGSLAGLAELEEINLSGASLTGSGLVHLTGLKQLESLEIPSTALDDAGLANLGRLTGLRRLYIGGGAYTDAGLASLSNLTELRELGLGSEGCTDAGLGTRVGLTNLRTLDIAGPRITDAWLDRIAAMKSLREVNIGGSHLSDEAIQRLHRALPKLVIYINGRQK